MSSFTKPLIVKHLDGRKWELMESFSYWTNGENEGDEIVVPAGFITDFASIPFIFWSIIGHPTGKHGAAAVIHDYLYATHLYTRKRCDVIFYEGMRVLKVALWRRQFMYRAVRLFAWAGWNNYRYRESQKDK